MKRFSIFIAITFVAFFALSQTGTHATGNTFVERFAGGPTVGDSGAYDFDKAHTFIEFKAGHNTLIEVPGFFRDFTGTVNFDAKDISKSSVEFTAKATSVDTGVVGRDNHLRTADFFEVAKYPDFTFKSTMVAKKGVTKSITFPFNIAGFLPANERNGGRMGITAETVINRRDFGV
ncbi:MAG: YceI family protein, partial [Pyrinomonadaceae bacterium]